MKDMEKERMDRNRNRWGIGKNVNFWNCIFKFVIRNPKSRRQIKHYFISFTIVITSTILHYECIKHT
jgi:hypothetical protein